MDEECSEAAPSGPGGSVDHVGPRHPRQSVWSQPQLWDASEIVIHTRMVIDGAGGEFTASVECTDFWSGERLACEVRPGLRFPADRLVALAWFEAMTLHYSDRCAPF